MEFEHVGKHCALETCNQKDFLPFKCDYCKREYCLAHRTYANHGCEGALSKDITSMDCPICQQSIKFDKTQDPNIIWDDHFQNKCTQQAKTKNIKKCGRSDCRTVLGPSNTYTCNKCHVKVCMSHRFPEDHQCKGLMTTTQNNRQQFLARFEQTSSTTKSNQGNKSSSTTDNHSKNNTKKPTTTVNDENSLRGSAARRIKNNSTTTLTTATNTDTKTSTNQTNIINLVDTDEVQPMSCPFYCGSFFTDPEKLTVHINTAHSETNNNNNNNNNRTNNPPPPPPVVTTAVPAVSSTAANRSREVVSQSLKL
jgi:predicted nucleic acid binding AN1-type Zn finger protein